VRSYFPACDFDPRPNVLSTAPPEAYCVFMGDSCETICELKIRDGWQPITLEEALRLNTNRIKRCPVCRGRVRAYQAAKNGIAAHFEHFQPHSGCYLIDTFDGNPRLHPRALK
jgi:hypothetical protein